MTPANSHEDDQFGTPKFKSLEEHQAYRKACAREYHRAIAAKKRCPVRKDDWATSRTVNVSGRWMQCRVVLRTEGTIEFWLKQYDELNPVEPKGTHQSYTFVLELGIKEDEEGEYLYDAYRP